MPEVLTYIRRKLLQFSTHVVVWWSAVVVGVCRSSAQTSEPEHRSLCSYYADGWITEES